MTLRQVIRAARAHNCATVNVWINSYVGLVFWGEWYVGTSTLRERTADGPGITLGQSAKCYRRKVGKIPGISALDFNDLRMCPKERRNGWHLLSAASTRAVMSRAS